jgi:hypothetical protein
MKSALCLMQLKMKSLIFTPITLVCGNLDTARKMVTGLLQVLQMNTELQLVKPHTDGFYKRGNKQTTMGHEEIFNMFEGVCPACNHNTLEITEIAGTPNFLFNQALDYEEVPMNQWNLTGDPESPFGEGQIFFECSDCHKQTSAYCNEHGDWS